MSDNGNLPVSGPDVGVSDAIQSTSSKASWPSALFLDKGAYNVSAARRLHGPLDMAGLQSSLDALVARHDRIDAALDIPAL